MTSLIGILGAAVLFGLFTLLRPRDKEGCTGNCVGCSRNAGTCANDGAKHEHDV